MAAPLVGLLLIAAELFWIRAVGARGGPWRVYARRLALASLAGAAIAVAASVFLLLSVVTFSDVP